MIHETFRLNNELIAWIQSQGLTMSQFANDIGVSRATMTHISNHRNKVSQKLLLKAGAIYRNFPLSELQRFAVNKSVPTSTSQRKSKPKTAASPKKTQSEPTPPKPYESVSYMSPEQLIMVEGGYFDIKLRRDLKGK